MSKKRKLTDDSTKGLHCLCKRQDDGSRDMVQCDFCDVWYHCDCIGLDVNDIEETEPWFCQSCIKVQHQNPTMSKKRLLGFQGRVAPSSGWNSSFPIEDIDERVIYDSVQTKRHSVEGYNLFREGRITGLNSNTLQGLVYFRAQCQAAMKANTYTIYVCFKDGGRKLKWATCSCPAGIDGQCKHFVASLYSIIDIYRQGVSTIPEVQTCTDRLQMWHVRKPTSDEPLLFSDIQFVKHDAAKPIKRDLCSALKDHHPIPEFGKSVSQERFQKLVSLYEAAGIGMPILETIKDNEFIPVLPKSQEDCSDLHQELLNGINGDKFDATKIESKVEQQHFKTAVDVDINECNSIEKNTRMQSKSAYWFRQREFRLTASNFGTFCKLKDSTNPVTTFEQKKKFFTTKSVRHGLAYEDSAFAKYVSDRNVRSCPVGLLVNPSMPYLAATPDRLVKTGGKLRLVEIKCPYSVFQRKLKISDMIKDKKFYLENKDGQLVLKRGHDYFYQIQGQLNISGIEVCDLVVFVSPGDICVVEVKRDNSFFEEHMLPLLEKVYFQHLLPHFVKELYSHI